MNFSLKRLTKYCIEFSTAPSKTLHRLERETNLKTLAPQMISGPLQGQLLRFLTMMIKPQYILEIGTFTGYAAIAMAEGLSEGGKLITIESNVELAYITQKYIKEAGLEEKIEALNGDAKAIIPTLDYTYDLVFIDAGKNDNAFYYDLVMDRINPGGFILVDNVLWSGKVTQREHDNDTRTIHAFNEKVHQDERVENVILPIRDGLTVIRKLGG